MGSLVIHDKRVPRAYIDSLSERLGDIQFIPFGWEGASVYSSVSCHPDIYMFRLDNRIIVHSPDLPLEFLDRVASRGIRLVPGEKAPGRRYPHTALYNAVRVGEVVFHAFNNTDPAIVEMARRKNLRKVDIPQGYARCSVLACSDRAIITSDKNIRESARREGIEALLISPGHIELPGERYGFIGGTGALAPDGRVVVLGDISRHPDADDIYGFISEHSRGCIQAPGLTLYDAGGLFFV